MNQQIGRTEWDRISASLDGGVIQKNAQQQRLFRLFQALRAGDLDTSEKWLRDGAPLDMPLILDEAKGGPPRAEQFRFAELEAQSIYSITALGYMAGRGELEAVEWLLKRGASVTAPFAHGRDAAWIAMEMSQPALLEYLLDKGAPVNLSLDRQDRRTRLIEATKMSNVEMVEILLHRKAKVTYHDIRGRTALHYNFEKDPYTDDDLTIGRLLIDWGGIPGAEDLKGTTPADLAHTDMQYAMLRQHGLEKKWEQGFDHAPVAPEELEEDVPFDPKDIVRPEVGDPGLPQLNKAPIFKKPRF